VAIYFAGIDVQSSRESACAVIDDAGRPIDAAWVDCAEEAATTRGIVAALRRYAAIADTLVVGIDAPRQPLESSRQWFWDRPRKRWRARHPTESGRGRHCEVAIAVHRLANPQWTPLRREAPAWMQVGFTLFRTLESFAQVHEVFPSASYKSLAQCGLALELDLRGFHRNPKDMLDAYVAAATAREFHAGRGAAVGGGDGLGPIVLPRPLATPIHEVLAWPGA
jgi:predicted nuclease with RNAse H fold